MESFQIKVLFLVKNGFLSNVRVWSGNLEACFSMSFTVWKKMLLYTSEVLVFGRCEIFMWFPPKLVYAQYDSNVLLLKLIFPLSFYSVEVLLLVENWKDALM